MKTRTIAYLSSIFVLIFSVEAFGQSTLDWSSSFSSTWADGALTRTANNVVPGTNCTVTITNSEPGSYQNITGSVAAPGVNTNNGRSNFFIIAGSGDCLEIDVDWSSDNAYVDVVYDFTKPVYNLVFRVGDIDKAFAGSNTYYDQVTITGMNGTATVLPSTITQVNAANYVNITGNVVHANTSNSQGGNASTNTTNTNTQQGTVEVNFGAQGVTKLTIRYANHPSAQSNPNLQAIAIGNLSFSTVTVSGTVWSDINNSAANTFTNIFTSGETGSNGGGLYVNLVNNSGNVVTSAAVAADGTYSLNAPQSTNNLTLRLSTTQGTAGSAAPANSIPTGWTNTSPLQTATFNTATANITGRDFGMEQLPQTATSVQTSVGNPGGYNFTTVATPAFQTGTGGNPNTSDAGGGTITNMRITSFPANANAIRINTTTYTNGGTCPPATICTAWPAGGVTITYTNGTGPSVPVSIDPIEGNVSAVITFAAIDNAGKEDASPGTVTVPFATIPLSGVVFNDANGNLVQNLGELLVNGLNIGVGLLPGAPLHANLVDAAGTVIASVPVGVPGTYTFPNIPQNTGNLVVQINTVAGTVGLAKPAQVLPPGWASAGENKNGQAGAADAAPNGEIVVTAGTVTITLQNFGLDRLPVAASKFYSIANPAVNSFITLNGSGPLPGTLSGSDAEDGSLGSSSRVAITSLPAEGNELWYDASQITVGADGTTVPSVSNPYVVNNFNPALLRVRPTVLGSLGTTFTYAFIDAASLQGNAVSYMITWENPLPVTLTKFVGKTDNSNTILNWKVENQEDFDRYEIEYSVTGSGGYHIVGTVHSNDQLTGSYDFTHVNAAAGGNAGYYRLKMIDKGGTYKYSYVISVRFDKLVMVDVRPTLLQPGEPIRVNLAGNNRQMYKIRLVDITGRLLQEKISNTDNYVLLETSNLKAGAYLIRIMGESMNQTFKLVVQ